MAGSLVWSCSWDRKILVWNPETLELLGDFPTKHTDSVTAVAVRFNKYYDQLQAWTASGDRAVNVWAVPKYEVKLEGSPTLLTASIAHVTSSGGLASGRSGSSTGVAASTQGASGLGGSQIRRLKVKKRPEIVVDSSDEPQAQKAVVELSVSPQPKRAVIEASASAPSLAASLTAGGLPSSASTSSVARTSSRGTPDNEEVIEAPAPKNRALIRRSAGGSKDPLAADSQLAAASAGTSPSTVEPALATSPIQAPAITVSSPPATPHQPPASDVHHDAPSSARTDLPIETPAHSESTSSQPTQDQQPAEAPAADHKASTETPTAESKPAGSEEKAPAVDTSPAATPEPAPAPAEPEKSSDVAPPPVTPESTDNVPTPSSNPPAGTAAETDAPQSSTTTAATTPEEPPKTSESIAPANE